MNNDDNKKSDGSNGDPTKNSWWSRCRRGMSNVWEFAQEHATKSLLQIRRLQQISKIAGWSFIAAGTFGLPGAAYGSVFFFSMSQVLKLVGDQAREVKDIADDLEASDFESEADTRTGSNEDRILELETMVKEQQQTIVDQVNNHQVMVTAHEQMMSSVEITQNTFNVINESHNELARALKRMLDEEKANQKDIQALKKILDVDDSTSEDVRALKAMVLEEEMFSNGLVRDAHRERYSRELDSAEANGDLYKTDFDPNTDDFIHYVDEGDESPALR